MSKQDQEQLYEEELEILSDAKKILAGATASAISREDYERLVKHYEKLLHNIVLITSISDRFQEKYKLANDKLQEQAQYISEINAKLDLDNRQLKSNLKELTREKELTELEEWPYFEQLYPDRETCLRFIEEMKWAKGYSCRKCGNEKYCEGNSYLARRCTKCRYDESVTAYTLYHKCKFDLNKALYMTVLIHRKLGKVSSYELSRQLGIRQKTCWSFKNKVMEAMDKIGVTEENHSLDGWKDLIPVTV